jgi:Uncharacterized ACR, COG1430.
LFDWEAPAWRGVHSVAVRFPIDVIFLEDDSVQQIATLPSWRGWCSGRADRIIEMSAGQAEDVEIGDTIRVREVVE